MNLPNPYSNLTPDLILDAIESIGYQCNGSLLALNSYENRVYQVGIEESAPVIAKFYRPLRWSDEAILEEHQFTAELQSHEIPVICPEINSAGITLHHYQGFRFAMFQRQAGRPVELDNGEHLEWLGRFLGRLHAVGACRSFTHRGQLDVTRYGYEPYQFLVNNHFIPAELQSEFDEVINEALKKIEHCFKLAGSVDYIRLHGDCHAGNVLWNDGGPWLVDLDDCLMGPAIQDIWMLLSGDKAQVDSELTRILNGYYEFFDFNRRELILVEPLRTLRMMHYSAWLAKRWEDPAFPLHFPWFNTLNYWQSQLSHFREQVLLLNAVEAYEV